MVGVNPNPIMPGITDDERSLDRLAKACRDAGAVTFGGGPLFLMPSAQKVFFPFLEREFPHLVERYRELYARSAYLGRDYKDVLAARVRRSATATGWSPGWSITNRRSGSKSRASFSKSSARISLRTARTSFAPRPYRSCL